MRWAAAVACLLVGAGACAPAGDRLWALAAGPGRAALLEAGPALALVDSGAAADSLDLSLGQALPPWRRRLDLVILTGAGRAALGGLAAIGAEYSAGRVVAAPSVTDSATATTALQQMQLHQVPVEVAGDGEQIAVGDCLVTLFDPGMEPLPSLPPSLIVSVACAGGRAWLTGNAGPGGLSDLLAQGRLSAGGAPVTLLCGARAAPTAESLVGVPVRDLIIQGGAALRRPGLPAARSTVRTSQAVELS